MASATSLTASKISLLVGLGFRRSFLNLAFAFSSALLCPDSGPSLSCIDLSKSMQDCQFLSCFMQLSFSGKTAGAAEQLPRRNGPNRKTHPTCAAQPTTNTPKPNKPTDTQAPRTTAQDLQTCSVGLMGLTTSHRRAPQGHPALRRPPEDGRLDTRSDS
jgi:hypothetical protein